MPQLTSSDRIGTTVGGRYEIRRLLGEGGFSAVFEAVHNVTGREVALKLLHPHLVTTEQITERFLMEARAMARIRHDGIVQVLDAGKDPDGTVYIALELLSGESLETTLQRAGRLTWGEAVSIGIDVLAALAEAHNNKIIHRDIKPGNIFIVRKGDGSSQAKLLDFGIAHVAQAKGKLTQAGMILGTPEYMSPEQGRSGNVGPEADLWSVGIVLYECITGGTPFMSESTTEILLKVQTETAPRLIDVEPSVPLPVSLAVQHALAREVKDRYRSADDMRDALQKAVADTDKARAANPQRSIFRGPSIRREPPETMDAIIAKTMPPPSAAAPPRTEVLPPTVPAMHPTPTKTTHLAAQLAPPKAPPKPAATAASTRLPGGGRTFELPDADPKPEPKPEPKPDAKAARTSRPDEPVLIKPGRLVVEEVVASRRFDDDESRRFRRPTAAGDTPATPRDRVEAPAETPRFTLDDALSPPPRSSHEPPLPTAGNAAVSRPSTASPLPARPDEFRLDAAERVSGPELKRESPSPKPPPAPPATPTTLSGATREPAKAPATFQSAPSNARNLWIIGAAGAAVVVGLAVKALTGETTPQPRPVARDGGEVAALPVDAGAAPALRLRLRESNIVHPSTALGDVSEIARHAAVSRGEVITTQRVIATCVPNADGPPTLYFHPVTRGEALGSTRAPIACAGFDLGVVSDVTGDGTDDVVAVSAGHDAVLLFDSATRQEARRFPIAGARGIAVGGGFRSGNETFAVVYTEPAGSAEPTTVVAQPLRGGAPAWRASGGSGLSRFGQPVELGLAVGRDVDRDGVADVLVGVGPNIGAGERAVRCVQVLSGATGRALWSPKCRGRGRGSQSVSLGPDVTGDGVPDIVVGTERPDGSDPAVEIRSGADGSEVRGIAPPAGEAAQGFGWPVALLGPMTANGRPRVVVGSVGGTASGFYVFDAQDGALVGRMQLQGVGSATLRLFGVEPNSRSGPWSLVVGAPADGVRVFAASTSEDDDP